MTQRETLGLKQSVVKIEYEGAWSGQGVVVPGDIVLTAAHCLPIPVDEFLYSETQVKIQTPNGKEGWMHVIFADGANDLAALTPSERSPLLLDGITPIRASLEWSRSLELEDREDLDGTVFTHNRGEVSLRYHEVRRGSACYDAEHWILAGTSGGPIVDASGLLIGIVSTTIEPFLDEDDDPNDGHQQGQFMLLGASSPPWLAMEISSSSLD